MSGRRDEGVDGGEIIELRVWMQSLEKVGRCGEVEVSWKHRRGEMWRRRCGVEHKNAIGHGGDVQGAVVLDGLVRLNRGGSARGEDR